MGLKICVLGSGSKGNCTCVWSEKTALLIDVGLSLSRIEKCLSLFGIDPYSITILLTHTHTDHVSGLEKFVKKYNNEVYVQDVSYYTLFDKCNIYTGNVCRFTGSEFFVGDITVVPEKLSHDVPCVGYSLVCNGKKISFATDTGKLTDRTVTRFSDADLVVLESNHDEDMLRNSTKYSAFLKQRILSDRGHLSNATASDCAVKLAMSGVRQFILAHLSQENNIPELAFATVRDKLSQHGYIEGKDVCIEVALQERMSGLFEIK
ncbi:MAG: MBL fold metallo-hydrolase [Clostridiales bacterium]|nr:MBL fold metallo-hydrolase [Clostridiales bacterium]